MRLRQHYNRRLIPKKLRERVMSEAKGCAHCGSASKLTIDHIHPFSNGGTNQYENLQVLCRGCNASKGHKEQSVVEVDDYPIFHLYGIEELSNLLSHEGGPKGKTGYSPSYLLDVKEGRKPATGTFKFNALSTLHLTERELFGPIGGN